ncbi:MAG: amidohydrolase family protein [Candidatus Bathyarchaeia archaeon]
MIRNIIFKDGTIIDGTGRAPIKGSIIIEGSRIKSVGEDAQVPEGENVEIIDISGKTILPGLIDTHIHIYRNGEPQGSSELALRQNAIYAAVKAVPHLKRTLEMGITTARDGGCGYGWMEVALKRAINNGFIQGPRYFTSGYHLTVTGGHGYFFPPWLGNIRGGDVIEQVAMHVDGPDEWRRAARLNIYHGTDNVKMVTSRDLISSGDPTSPQATYEEIKAAVDEAHKMGKKAIAHSSGHVAMMNAIRAGVDSLVHGFYLDEEVAETMVKNNVFLEPTNTYCKVLVERGPGEQPDFIVNNAIEAWKDRERNFKMYLQKRVKITFGTDAGEPYIRHGDSAYELSVLVELGMTPMQALIAATKTAAECLGIEDQVGTLEPGKVADIIVVDGNPLDNINILHIESKIKLVMKEGKIVVTR